MSTILRSIDLDHLESTKLALNLLFLAATVGVWVGVWMEGKRFLEKTNERGWRLLVACLGIEAIFGIAILQIDSEISRRQAATIAEVQTSNAELLVQAGTLQKETAEARERAAKAELDLKNFRAFRTLTKEQQDRITTAMRPFAGTRFDGAWASIDPELDLLFTSIEDALIAAGLVSIPFVGPGFSFGREGRSGVGMAGVWGLVIHVNPVKDAELMSAALSLVAALAKEGVGVNFIPKVGFVSTNTNTLHILVGAKK
jgi:hypothetical protein